MNRFHMIEARIMQEMAEIRADRNPERYILALDLRDDLYAHRSDGRTLMVLWTEWRQAFGPPRANPALKVDRLEGGPGGPHADQSRALRRHLLGLSEG